MEYVVEGGLLGAEFKYNRFKAAKPAALMLGRKGAAATH